MIYLYSGKFDFGPQVSKLLQLHKNEMEKATEKSSQELDIKQQESNSRSFLNQAIELLIDFLRVADEYLLEDVKNQCQTKLITMIDETTFNLISEIGELYNAERIEEYCNWYSAPNIQNKEQNLKKKPKQNS